MRPLLLTLVFLLLPPAAFAEVKLIALQHRPAEEIISQVSALLDEKEKVAAAGNHLILIADGETLEAAEKLIELLDRPLVNLLIRIRQSDELQQVGKDSTATVRYGSRTGLSTSATIGRHYGNSSSSQEQILTLVEGGKGLIEIGQEIPYTEHWSAVTGDISGYSETIDYKTIATGFWVSPVRLSADKVLVDVEPYISNSDQASASDPPRISSSQLRTRLLIPIGQWYPLGQQLQQRDRLSQAIISWRSSSGHADRVLQIRIELAE